MTDAMVEVAQAAAPELAFEGWTSQEGPPAIQGPEDGQAATPPLLNLVHQASDQGADGIIIGCFDDTALAEAASLAKCPVVGLGQASFHYAALRQWRFSVVTTLGVSVPIIEANIHASGLGHMLGRVRASEVPVLALESDPAGSMAQILDEATRAVGEDGIEALVLGCAGMVQVTQAIRSGVTVGVIDPVVAAATCMAWVARD